MIDIIRYDPETDSDVVVESYDEQQVKEAILAARFAWTYRDGPVFALCDADEEMPELLAVGASPGPAYSRNAGYLPEHPSAQGFRSDREWRLHHEFAPIVREIHAEGGFR